MNLLSKALALLITVFVIASCNKDTVEQKSTEKMNEKKEALNDKKGSDNTTTNVSTGDIQLYKVEKVEKQSGKKIAPNFMWTEDGKKMSLADLKGKVVLVNLWATWCGPCIKEMPDLSKISNELKDKDFRLLGMNVFQQENSKKVEDFLKTNPVTYTILDGNTEVVDALGEASGGNIEAVPTTFIIDKEGKIAETIVGGRSKEAFLTIINKYLN
ncbi:MAG: TlpA disulfide reductase family protein [bacterium]